MTYAGLAFITGIYFVATSVLIALSMNRIVDAVTAACGIAP